MIVKEITRIPRAENPEQVGVSSAEFCALLDDLKESGIDNHSVMVIRHDKVAAESYTDPYKADTPHAMYSVSKTITATAVGLAIDEGYFSLDTHVMDFFPDYEPKTPDERLNEMKIRHLVSMTSGKNPSWLTDKTKPDWIKTFFNAPWKDRPGEAFFYVNDNIYMLCVIIKRATGLSVTEFLEPRLYQPLGIKTPFWETDHHGVECGAWGICLSTEDLAKIMLCYKNGGKFEGKQILPENWVKEATSIQIDNSEYSKAGDASSGYGFCLWQNSLKGSFRADGMFSQFGIVIPEYDAVLVLTDGEVDEQKTRNCLWRHVPKMFIEESDERTMDKDEYDTKIVRSEERQQVSMRTDMEKKIDGRTIRFRKNLLLNIIGFPMSVLPFAATYMMRIHCGNIDKVVFNFEESECIMEWSEGKYRNTVVCGMDGHYRYGKISLAEVEFTVCCSAEWKDGETLEVWIRPLQSIACRHLNFNFKGNYVKMKPSTVSSLEAMATNLANGVFEIVANKTIAKIAGAAMRKAWPILEPAHRGILLPKSKK